MRSASLPTPHPRLRIARVLAPKVGALADEVTAWLAGAGDLGAEAVRLRLKTWIPEYVPGGPAASR